MSDPSKSIAAKAEARRRKILENAQRRLNKVQELKGVISQSSSGKYVKTYVYCTGKLQVHNYIPPGRFS